MDIGAVLCRPRAPRCPECPLEPGCATAAAGASADPALGRRPRQPAYEGSFRQRRGIVLSELRAGPRPSVALDGPALASLVEDGLAALEGPLARLP
jgi:A/G-specific adenine glycosylase